MSAILVTLEAGLSYDTKVSWSKWQILKVVAGAKNVPRGTIEKQWSVAGCQLSENENPAKLDRPPT